MLPCDTNPGSKKRDPQYLVNISHIEQMIRTSERVELLLTGGIMIPIARNRKGEVLGRLM
ncbi:MAG: hypothetical protein IPF93_12690 [Saprospiraceae bacterium]|nr:hypothetical protein [Saprospiraceae bacterium]MBL0110453.1 hypothetical protein [Saprospiraceae bacterium]